MAAINRALRFTYTDIIGRSCIIAPYGSPTQISLAEAVFIALMAAINRALRFTRMDAEFIVNGSRLFRHILVGCPATTLRVK